MKRKYDYERAILDEEWLARLKAIAKKEKRTSPAQAGILLQAGIVEYERLEAQRKSEAAK